MKYEALIFDLDGVLVESEPLHVLAWCKTLAGFEVIPETNWYNEFLGVPDDEMVDTIIHRYGLETSPFVLLEKKRIAFTTYIESELCVFPGLREELGSINIKKAVVTSSSYKLAENILGQCNIKNNFEVIVTSDDVKNRKPAPDGYLLAAERLKACPPFCIAMEDSFVGACSAKAAGMTVVGISNPLYAEDLSIADHVFSSTVEAIRYVKQTYKL